MRVRKVVSKSEANGFLEVLGMGGELGDDRSDEVKRQVTTQPPSPRVSRLLDQQVPFQPGDRVRFKVTQAEGTVCLRTKFFRENLYFITFPQSYYVFDTVADRTQRAAGHAATVAWAQEWARSHGAAESESQFDFPEYQPRPWHEEGPFYESDLELVSNRPDQSSQEPAR